MNISLQVDPKKTAKIMFSIIAILLFLHSLYVFTLLVYGYKLRHIFQFFDLNSEGNLPTMYQVGALIISALLLTVVGYVKKTQKDKYTIHWFGLGAIFFFLAYDEASKMHERLNVITRAYLPESSMDFLYFAWVIPYAVLALTIAFIYLKFLLNLPKRTALLFIFSGAVFVTGALGFEMLTSYYRGVGFTIQLVLTIEETLEMTGIVFFIYSILDYIKINFGSPINIATFNHNGNTADLKTDFNSNTFPKRQEPVHIK